ncbi:uncharacterized protein BP5553_05021 [Venustampulla echinocandica]|uniref:Epoxide hydrolase N-terminal domain-containing protein n=1 Tax=Venustampulla echinocandica TaxID=2656787 RepID=A0A370TPZ5_9HELO|nr:uncharacterized protein BP5553_05021 [Venustampulla echinocandica]RDL37588.1 hypothetical protein BP5553_05021 [Venustampulla echinocandica]
MSLPTPTSKPTPTPFKISISDTLLSFINDRVRTARIPGGVDLPPGKEWARGVPPSVMHHLQEYWTTKYDWRAVEARINSRLKMFTLPIEEEGEEFMMHFVDKIIDSLVCPSDPNQQAYHVVAPSLPGFAFSSASSSPEFSVVNMASINNKLMHALGYSKYIAQGGDWGSMTSRAMGIAYPESCVAVHVNMLGTNPPSWWASPVAFVRFMLWAAWTSNQEGGKLNRMMWWGREELVDSPLGMLAWLRDKMEPIVDDDFTWQDEDVITWAMMYIIPGSSGQADIYTNTKGEKSKTALPAASAKLSSDVDFGASLFPKDTFNIPYFWASSEVAKNIVFWREHSRGGHFAAVEKPVELVNDIREFTGLIKKDRVLGLRAAGKLKV